MLFKAITPVLCYTLEANELVALLSHSAFNYALIKEFKFNQKLFRNLEAFITYVSNACASGTIAFEEVLAKYRKVRLPLVLHATLTRAHRSKTLPFTRRRTTTNSTWRDGCMPCGDCPRT